MPNDLWDIQNPMEFMEFVPLFNPQDSLRLSEADIPLSNYTLFALGGQIAWFHAEVKMPHGDLHLGNILTDKPKRKGRKSMRFIDPVGGIKTKSLEPKSLVQDFIPLSTWNNKEQMEAIVAGYAKYAYIFIDPHRTNYTETFLSLIGGQVVSKPRPRQMYLNAQELFENLAVYIELRHQKIYLAGVNAAKFVVQLESNSESFIVFLIGLTILGIKLDGLVHPIDKKLLHSDLASHLFQVVSAFVSHSEVIPRAHYESDLIHLGVQVLQVLRDVLPVHPDQLKAQPDITAMEMMVKFLAASSFSDATINRYFDYLIDCSNFFSVYLDSLDKEKEFGRVLSMNFVQFSFMLFQYSRRDLETDERRELYLDAMYFNLSWQQQQIEKCNSDNTTLVTFVSRFTCDVARNNALISLFENANKMQHPFWDVITNVLHNYRCYLLALLSYLQKQLDADSARLVQLIASQAATRLAQISYFEYGVIIPYMKAGLSKNPFEDIISGTKQKEIEWANELIDFLKTNSIASDPGIKLLSRIKEFI